MDGQVVGRPDDNGAADGDGHSQAAPANGSRRLPLTIREVVRRGRLDMEESQRLRAEIEELRRRAESAERALEAAPRHAAEVSAVRRPTLVNRGASRSTPASGGAPASPAGPVGTSRLLRANGVVADPSAAIGAVADPPAAIGVVADPPAAIGVVADRPVAIGAVADPPVANGVPDESSGNERARAEVPTAPVPARPSRWNAAVVVPSPTRS